MIIFSWIGSLLLLVSYWLTATDRTNKASFIMNIVGCILIIISAVSYQLWSVVFLNTIWAGISLYGLCTYDSFDIEPLKDGLDNESPTRFDFGRYKGKLVSEILRCDPNYVVWAYYNCSDFPITEDEAFEAFQSLRKTTRVQKGQTIGSDLINYNKDYNPLFHEEIH